MVEGVALPIHTLLITALGVNILDNQDLEAVADMAAKLKRWEFMITINPLPVIGGTGSPMNTMATFNQASRLRPQARVKHVNGPTGRQSRRLRNPRREERSGQADAEHVDPDALVMIGTGGSAKLIDPPPAFDNGTTTNVMKK